jgi:hypothetical protein
MVMMMMVLSCSPRGGDQSLLSLLFLSSIPKVLQCTATQTKGGEKVDNDEGNISRFTLALWVTVPGLSMATNDDGNDDGD